MRCFIILAIVILGVSGNPDKPLNRRRGGRQLDTGYGAPAAGGYGAPSEEVLDIRAADELPGYAEEPLETYGDLSADASALDEKSADAGLDMLMKAVPGIPGEDYPIYSEAPETEWSCEGQVNGGYYADPSAECQVFHICSDDGTGNLAKYSFLCPNGTIFNQAYFICDWWFNVDCSEAEALAESRNAEIASERDAADARLAESADLDAAASNAYGAPEDREAESSYGGPIIEDREAQGSYGAPQATYNNAEEYDY